MFLKELEAERQLKIDEVMILSKPLSPYTVRVSIDL